MRHSSLSRTSYRLAALVVMVGALIIGGSGDDDGAEVVVDVDNAVATVDAGLAGAVVGDVFTFAGGIPEFGTTTSTTVTFTGTGTTADIGAGAGNVLTTTVTFASCTFTPTAVSGTFTFPIGDPITIATCDMNISADNVAVGGSAETGSISLILNAATSASVAADVALDGTTVVVNGEATDATVSATGATGTGGTGSG